MKVIDYIYEQEFSSPYLIGEEYNKFKNKEAILEYISTGYCPSVFIEGFPFYQPIKKGKDCAVASKSEKQQKKLCKECWGREYAKPLTLDDEYEMYLRLKAKFEGK